MTSPASLATLNGLIKMTQTECDLSPALAELLGRKGVTIRRIPASTFRALFPFLPAAVVDGGPEEASLTAEERRLRLHAREIHWMETAPAAERVRYRIDLEQVKFRALALTLVEPRMTEEEVERLGDDVEPLYLRLLEISGLLVTPPVAADAPSEAAPA